MPRKGEVWKINHSRKGPLTVWLLNDADDEWFDCEIVEGRCRYMSEENNILQDAIGKGTPGAVETFRTSFCQFIEKVAEATRP